MTCSWKFLAGGAAEQKFSPCPCPPPHPHPTPHPGPRPPPPHPCRSPCPHPCPTPCPHPPPRPHPTPRPGLQPPPPRLALALVLAPSQGAAGCYQLLPAGPRWRCSMLRSMQRVLGLFIKQRQKLPSCSPSGQPRAAATAAAAYKLQEKDLGRLHRRAARGDLTWLRRWRWWVKSVGIDKRDKEKRTPLHLACANGHVDVVRFLIQENCQLNLADNFKRSPLMKAVQCQQEECVAVLLEHGADPNLVDADGNTALHLAVLSPNTAVAGLLLEHNAHMDAQNQEGHTPLNLAVSKHHEEMVELLQKKGADRCAQDQCESKLLLEDMDSVNTEESSAASAEDNAFLCSSCPVRTADSTWAALAQDRAVALPAGDAAQEEGARSPRHFEDRITQLQQELLNALKKQSVSEALLETTENYNSELEEDKLRLQKELDRVETELRELEEQHLQSEHRVHDLKASLDNKEREVIASSQKLQDLLLASSGTNTTIKQLEEHVQRLEIENARLEATVQQQSNRIEALQRDLQASASVYNRLEDLITGLRTTQAAAEDHQQQMQKQNVLTLTSKDLHSMREEQLKSRSHLEERVAQLDREKAELLKQCENGRKKVKKLVELKRPVELRLDQEMKRNIELQKDCKRLKRLLSRAMKKLRVYEERESQLNLQGEMKNRYSEMVNEVDRLRTKVGELSQQLEIESKKCMQLEAQNQDLREELSTMRGNHEKLEKSKCQLKEKVANLKYRLETNMVDHSQIEQYKREMEERADQEIRQKLQEVNLFLQTQAASQDRLEQIRASHHASLRSQLKHRIKDLECELDRIKNTQQDSIFQKESTQAEVERYKELYLEEVKIRRGLANKLEKANERLAEANAKLLQERHRSKSLITSSIVSGGLAASPVLYSTELGHLGNSLALNRSLSLGGSFLSPTHYHQETGLKPM
ncbi:ankyrin repeat domain-containing protein 7 [Tyto alba]|uniref:ankyrin repeat domain-containing protein 7 n=1 Tax=Tyto alba TaxID=56313 RepID=UPI001C66694A|nr:ankyrin repeat domain-containing protein 7 [Tyto alba]